VFGQPTRGKLNIEASGFHSGAITVCEELKGVHYLAICTISIGVLPSDLLPMLRIPKFRQTSIRLRLSTFWQAKWSPHPGCCQITLPIIPFSDTGFRVWQALSNPAELRKDCGIGTAIRCKFFNLSARNLTFIR